MQDILELNKRLQFCGDEIIKLMNGTHSLPFRKGVNQKARIKFHIRYWEFQYRKAEEIINTYYDVIKADTEEESFLGEGSVVGEVYDGGDETMGES